MNVIFHSHARRRDPFRFAKNKPHQQPLERSPKVWSRLVALSLAPNTITVFTVTNDKFTVSAKFSVLKLPRFDPPNPREGGAYRASGPFFMNLKKSESGDRTIVVSPFANTFW